MSREIKFRAWDGEEMHYSEKDGLQTFFAYVGSEAWESCPLMQFTGLTDKNGKEIYEGDVVILEGGHPMEIKFIWGAFLADRIYGGQEAYRMEVIGNIYENPELIGV